MSRAPLNYRGRFVCFLLVVGLVIVVRLYRWVVVGDFCVDWLLVSSFVYLIIFYLLARHPGLLWRAASTWRESPVICPRGRGIG